ncbi:mitochondrial ACP precursor, putative [Plasmodium gallinaceum]|uniref:Mitochondrial ACP, putative n=1 Tax=Plasmodium gallinaceum TaxID=5849 RepID=A0A1J1GXA4_PLAGA|nr:mitochondrial ACP precursor, putative [Plasmodium gallinaceum]CRG95925.1 mitochondrial ACP precursor, putative [Plasmodium gallinaceum]
MKKKLIQKIFFNKNINFSYISRRGYFKTLLQNDMKHKWNGFCKNNYIKSEQFVNFSTEKKSELNFLSKEQIEEKVITVLKKYLPNDAEIKYEEELEKNKTKDNRAWDFLDTVEFLIDIESEFNITIPDETADNIKTLQELIDYLVQLNTKKP